MSHTFRRQMAASFKFKKQYHMGAGSGPYYCTRVQSLQGYRRQEEKTNYIYVYFPLYFFGKYLEIAEILVYRNRKYTVKHNMFRPQTHDWSPNNFFFILLVHFVSLSKNPPSLPPTMFRSS